MSGCDCDRGRRYSKAPCKGALEYELIEKWSILDFDVFHHAAYWVNQQC